MFKIIVMSSLLAAMGYIFAATALILSQRPKDRLSAGTLEFSTLTARPAAPIAEIQKFRYSDGNLGDIRYAEAQGSKVPLIVLVHGSGWYGQQFDHAFDVLQDQADVLVPDLRGHGPNAKRRGDVAYIGQLEDDLAQLISAKRKDGQKVVMLGHSSGGGLVIRMAGGRHGDLIDQALLIAPYIHFRAPTMRPNSGGWARPLTRRLIGLSMLNLMGVKFLNHLTVVQFAMPQDVLDGALGRHATLAYSYRLNTSYAPRHAYGRDIEQLPDFDVIVGSQDEAFVAQAYESLFKKYSKNGKVHLIEGAGHLDAVHDPRTWEIVRARLYALSSP